MCPCLLITVFQGALVTFSFLHPLLVLLMKVSIPIGSFLPYIMEYVPMNSSCMLVLCVVPFFFSLACRKSSAHICTCLMHHCFLMMMHPIFITLILYDLLLWSSEPSQTTVAGIHGPPSSCCTSTVDPVDRNIHLLWESLFL